MWLCYIYFDTMLFKAAINRILTEPYFLVRSIILFYTIRSPINSNFSIKLLFFSELNLNFYRKSQDTVMETIGFFSLSKKFIQ